MGAPGAGLGWDSCYRTRRFARDFRVADAPLTNASFFAFLRVRPAFELQLAAGGLDFGRKRAGTHRGHRSTGSRPRLPSVAPSGASAPPPEFPGTPPPPHRVPFSGRCDGLGAAFWRRMAVDAPPQSSSIATITRIFASMTFACPRSEGYRTPWSDSDFSFRFSRTLQAAGLNRRITRCGLK
jgi:hypothetical protein